MKERLKKIGTVKALPERNIPAQGGYPEHLTIFLTPMQKYKGIP